MAVELLLLLVGTVAFTLGAVCGRYAGRQRQTVRRAGEAATPPEDPRQAAVNSCLSGGERVAKGRQRRRR
jgi:hypothetical protein